MGDGGQDHALANLLLGKRLGIQCTGGWVGPRAGPYRRGKFHPYQDSLCGPLTL